MRLLALLPAPLVLVGPTHLLPLSYHVHSYALIIFEEIVDFNKAAIGLLMSGTLWTIYSDFDSAVAAGTKASPEVLSQLGE